MIGTVMRRLNRNASQAIPPLPRPRAIPNPRVFMGSVVLAARQAVAGTVQAVERMFRVGPAEFYGVPRPTLWSFAG